jgi:hypothetical protein
LSGTGQDLYFNSGVLNLNTRTVTVHNSGLNTGTTFVAGNFTVSGTGTFNMYNYSQSVSSYFAVSGASTFRVYNNFSKFSNSYADFHGGSATLYFDGPFSSTAGNFTSTSGNAYFASTYSRTGGSFSHNSGTVHFTGANATADVNASETFNNLTINKNHNTTLSITTGDIFYVLGILTFNNGKSDGGLIGSYSNINVEVDWDGGNTPLALYGSNAQSIDLTGATDKFDGSLTIQKTDGYVVTLLSNMTMDGTSQQIDLYSGILNLNNMTMSLYNSINNTGNLIIQGNFSISGNGTFNVYNHIHTTSSSFSFSGSPTYRVYNNFTQSTNSYAAFTAGSATVIIDGNFSKSAGTFVAPTTHLKVGGNWTVSGSYTNNGTVTFIGNDATFTGTHTFTNVVMDKNSGKSLTIANGSSILINSTLTLTTGIIFTSSTGVLTMQCNSNITAGTDCESPVSYVNGPLVRNLCTTTPTSLFYPTGKGGNYRPLWLVPTQTTNTSTGYTVEQFEGNPPNYCIPEGLSCMSKARWYRVTRSNNLPMVDPITLTYCLDDGVTHPNNLRIAKQDVNCWSDMGGVGTGTTKGTITSNVNFTEYGDFTLANDSNCLNPLPVKLISFNGKYSGGVEYLTWKTASEINNNVFEIERSYDQRIWNHIGTVAGNGTTNQISNYNFEDLTLNSGIKVVYYRLKQIDYDGNFEYSSVLAENFETKAMVSGQYKVYPNPATDQVIIDNISDKKPNNNFVITDINGSQLISDNISDTKIVDINKLANGLYFLTIYNSNDEVINRTKITVRR